MTERLAIRSAPEDLRHRLAVATERGERFPAAQAARLLLRGDKPVRAASLVAASAARFGADLGTTLRIALVSSFSIEFVHEPLIAHAMTELIHVELYQAGFNQVRQELLQEQSGLYRFAPNVLVLAVEGEQLAPCLYDGPPLTEAATAEASVASAIEEVRHWLHTLRSRTDATVLIHDFLPPRWPTAGILEGHGHVGQTVLVARLNHRLREIASEFPSVFVVGYEALVRRVGEDRWFDDRMAHYAKAPVARPMMGQLAMEYLKYLRAITGKTRKCLVLDLDNTLWGGVLGEDGPAGIALGATYPGSAYREFQQAIRRLKDRGVVLAIASKNNPADVEEVFSHNQQMILQKSDFAAMEIGWNDKATSIRRICNALSLNAEHLVFVDDNPAECAWVRDQLPMVTVVELPPQPEHYVHALLTDGWFDSLSMSAEDLRRSAFYAQRARAEHLREVATSLEDYYRQLRMVVKISPLTSSSLPRAAQLTQKTNQFNATTLRLSEAELQPRMADPLWVLRVVRVADMFGDHGIVGLMMAHNTGQSLDIETFLLSCRVIGRTIETAMLAHLAEIACSNGIASLVGRIVPSAKNTPVRDLYQRHGFCLAEETPDGAQRWIIDLRSNAISCPDWLEMEDNT